MLKLFITIVCFCACVGMTLIVLSRPALDPLLGAQLSYAVFFLLAVAQGLAWIRLPRLRTTFANLWIFLSVDTFIALLCSRFLLDYVPAISRMPNVLAQLRGWGGDMAEDGLVIEVYLFLFLLLAGLEGVIFYRIRRSRSR